MNYDVLNTSEEIELCSLEFNQQELGEIRIPRSSGL